MSTPLSTLRIAGAAALLGACIAIAAPSASASPIQVRDGNGGTVFSGNGVGSTNLTIRVDNVSQNVAAGAFALQYRLDSASSWVDFLTYCLEPDEALGISGSTIYTGDLQASLAGTTEYGAQADALGRLYRTHFADSLTSTRNTAAFQVALWELAFDTGSNLSTGRFQLVNAANVRTQAEFYLNTAGWLPVGDAGVVLRVGNQDLLIDLPPQPGEPVPEPATLALLGLGLVALGAARRRRSARPMA